MELAATGRESVSDSCSVEMHCGEIDPARCLRIVDQYASGKSDVTPFLQLVTEFLSVGQFKTALSTWPSLKVHLKAITFFSITSELLYIIKINLHYINPLYLYQQRQNKNSIFNTHAHFEKKNVRVTVTILIFISNLIRSRLRNIK